VLLSPLGLASTEGQPLLILGIYAILQVIFLFVFRSKKEV
ncbi:putative symporter YidK, partial [Pasteurella multocida subsp. multocida str. Anand1_cattle]